MRLITFECAGEQKLGAWILGDDLILDLGHARHIRKEPNIAFGSMLKFIESGEQAWDIARELLQNPPEDALIKTSSVRILSPLPSPTHFRDFLCFEEHLINGFKSAISVAAQQAENPEAKRLELENSGLWDIPKVWYQKPIYYNAARLIISGPNDDILWPSYSKIMDYELEMAAIIGKKGKDIKRECAQQHIFGYTIFNDWSARDEQSLCMEGKLGPGKGKDFDGGNTLGPCIVTADEIGDPYTLEMRAKVNGEQWSSGNTKDMYHRFEDCISDISRDQTIYPGEVLGSGTVGSGCGAELMRFLSDGDIVELEIEKIGVLKNRVLLSR